MSLLSTSHPTSDSGLTVSLHPLILLTISDCITRHTLRHQPRPIVGALLGQQNGRSVTLEHAFECETVEGPPASSGPQSKQHGMPEILLHHDWFHNRLQQYKDVHKVPALELVGWFTTTPVTGPEASHMPIHQQILQNYNETAVLLAFHPTKVTEGAGESLGGKLPLTIYESVFESAVDGLGGAAGAMEVDSGGDATENGGLDPKFRELPYTVETGEAEMIGVDFVARGGGNATTVDGGAVSAASASAPIAVSPKSVKGKGKPQASQTTDPKEGKTLDDTLSPEDEELLSSLTARANAVRMLHTRISLLKAYLSSLPPSYLTLPSPPNTTFPTQMQPPNPSPPTTAATSDQQPSEPNHPLLRSISALLARLPLLQPPPSQTANPSSPESPLSSLTLVEKTDTELVSLLSTLGNSIRDAKELGRKFGVVEGVRGAGRKGATVGSLLGGGGGGGGGVGGGGWFGGGVGGGGGG